MARTRMAPTLTACVQNGEGDPYQLERTVKSELRALLRVARAVERVKPYTPGWQERMERVFDASAALDRVSGLQRKGGAR